MFWGIACCAIAGQQRPPDPAARPWRASPGGNLLQAALLNREFASLINIVVILKTNLSIKKQAHVILFSTDWELPYEKLYDYYIMRFQIEFNFRDAKQLPMPPTCRSSW